MSHKTRKEKIRTTVLLHDPILGSKYVTIETYCNQDPMSYKNVKYDVNVMLGKRIRKERQKHYV